MEDEEEEENLGDEETEEEERKGGVEEGEGVTVPEGMGEVAEESFGSGSGS